MYNTCIIITNHVVLRRLMITNSNIETQNDFPEKVPRKFCWGPLSLNRNTEILHRSKNDLRNRVDTKYF